jgi:hypothetical protein
MVLFINLFQVKINENKVEIITGLQQYVAGFIDLTEAGFF